MNRLLNWFTLIIKKQKGLKRWQRVVTVLAAMITFATTYALILPAITVEKNSTEDVGGMYLEKTAKRDDLLEDNALEPVGVSIAADMDNAVSFAYSDDDMTATAIFSTDEIIPEGAELVVNNVTSDSEEYADLSGRAADLLDKEFIYDVTTCSFYDFALVCDNVDVTPKTGLVDIQIIFRNNTNQHVNDVVYVGRFARPSEDSDGFAPMAVSTVEAGAEADDAVSVNGTDVNDNSAGESGDPSAGEDELVSLNIDESSVTELSDGIITSLSLKGSDLSRSDSLVGIIAGYVDEEIKAAAAETDAEIPEYDESQDEDERRSPGEDASTNADNNVSTSPEEDSSGTSAEDERKEITDALQMKTLKASGSDYTVTLTYDESSKIPEGASLAVSDISKDSKEYQTYLDETKKAMGLTEEETLPSFAARFFDIKIMVDGQEFTPDSGVSVEITYAEPLAEYSDTEVNAVHFADEKAEAEVIEANTADIQDDGKATVEFTAETFSVYGVIYTVDFHWEVNGKTYDFSIPGGGFVSLEHLVEVLDIATKGGNSENGAENAKNGMDNENESEGEVPGIEEAGENSNVCEEAIKLNEVEVSEAARKFVADVVSLAFSSPKLVWVGKVDSKATVGGLKEANGLEVEYSANLTEEQIAEINAQTVEAGDWALISVHPFSSKESLTVTMKNGDTFVIRVTDAQQVTKIDENFDGETRLVIWGVGSDNNNYALYYNSNTHQVETRQIDPANIDSLDSGYHWTIKIQQYGDRYYIRPVGDPTMTLALDTLEPGSSSSQLINNQENLVYLYPPYTRHRSQYFENNYSSNNPGWILEGWGWTRLNLGYYSHAFEAHSWFCNDDLRITKVDVTVDEIDTTNIQRDTQLHYIITDHFIDEDGASTSIVRYNDRLDENNSINIGNNASDIQLFAGITISAGNEAVQITDSGTGEIKITNDDKTIHLVHVDYYYKKQRPTVNVSHFDENDKYDTKVLQDGRSYELGQERLHTEKTASVVEGGDGRSFNLTLEAWNVAWNIATIGMVLDASGSMAWDGAPGHYLKVNGDYQPYKFLSQNEVNKILCTDYSDYSVAGYGDYTYFVYEPGKSVNEYAPLGYWNGSTRVTNNNLTYLTVDGTLGTAYAVSTAGVQNNRPGWYYVNTGNANPFKGIGGAKDYNGIISPKNQQFTIDGKYIDFNNTGSYTISMREWFVNNDPKYRNANTYGSSQSTPAQFFVDSEGYLHCFYLHSDTIFESYVYAKQDNEPIKTEMLQDAIGSFVSTMDSIAPDSAFGMTRFSRSNTITTITNGFDDNQLPLLNWTVDSNSIISALNMAYGGDYKANSNQTDYGYANSGNLTVYDYGLTSNTSTQSGLSAFNTYLATNSNGALKKWAQDKARPVGNDIYEYDKYVIVFTDGKDTDRNNDFRDYAGNYANALKSKGYSVITVLLAPESAFLDQEHSSLNQEFTDAKNFLDSLNGPRNGGGTELNWTQETYIATAADKKALRTIFRDIANKVAKSLTDMTVRDYIDPRFQLVDENDEPIALGEHPELGLTLYYDAQRDMQYVEWTGQTIPTNNVMDNTVLDENGSPAEISLWSQTIRVRAKDDFLGGNEVLSNANVEQLNKVYPDGQPNSTDEKTSRTFPRTTVDPQILSLELGSTEDTMYLGETIDALEHDTLEDAIGATVASSWYYEYLERYGAVTNTDYISQIQQGTKIEIPYFYIPEDTTAAVFNSARLNPNNPDAYMKDRIGTLTYEWVPCDAEGNQIEIADAYNYLLTNIDDVHYRLKIKYTPYDENQRKTMVESMIDPDDHGRDVKDPVGTPQEEIQSSQDEGIAAVHVVSGKLMVQKTIKTADIQDYFANNPSKTAATFEFSLSRAYDALDETYPNLSTDYVDGYPVSGGYQYPATIKAAIQKSDVATLDSNSQEYVVVSSELIEKLPVGTYTLTETDNGDFVYVNMTDATSEVFADAETYGAKVTCEGNSATIYIGVVNSGIPATATVKTGSPYLNAQEGAVKVLNKVKPLGMLRKADMTNSSRPLDGAVFSFYKEVPAGTTGALTEPIPEKNVVLVSSVTSGDYEQETGADAGEKLAGYVSLGALDTDGIYYLVENTVPVGYVSPEWKYVKITLADDQIGWTAYKEDGSIYGSPQSAAKAIVDGKNCYTVTILNNPGAALPNTGGPGTWAYTILGSILILGAGAILWRRRRLI